MEIRLENAGKRFNREWIFKDWNQAFHSNHSYVLLGGNGSGKSTALKCLLGYASLSFGTISYSMEDGPVKSEKAYRMFSFCSPYMDLYEELSLKELLKFHFSLRVPSGGMSNKEIAERSHLTHAWDKQVKHFSSGMKQRLKLGLAFFTQADAILLDEPISNLDKAGVAWYRDLAEEAQKSRLIIVASNQQEDEFFFCDQKIKIENLKQL